MPDTVASITRLGVAHVRVEGESADGEVSENVFSRGVEERTDVIAVFGEHACEAEWSGSAE